MVPNSEILTMLCGSDKLKVLEMYQKKLKGFISVKKTPQGLKLLFDKKSEKSKDGFVSVEELYNKIKDESWVTNDPLDGLNVGSFLAQLSFALNRIPKAVEKFELLYKERPEFYYQSALLDEYYNSKLINDGDLRTDIVKRKIYSVLLSAEADNSLKSRICEILYSLNPKFKPLVEKLDISLVEFLEVEQNSNILFHIIAYLIMQKHGKDQRTHVFNYIIAITKQNDILCDRYMDTTWRLSETADVIDKDLFKYVRFEDENVWKIIKTISTCDDLHTFADYCNYIILGQEKNRFGSQQTLTAIEKIWSSDQSLAQFALLRAGIIMQWFSLIANVNGISTSEFCANMVIDSKKRRDLLSLLVSYYAQKPDAPQPLVTIDSYVAACIFYFLMERIADGKKLYFENNNETMYSHVSALETRIEEQKSELNEQKETIAKKDEEIAILHNEIEVLSSAASKEDKAILKPYLDENAQLRKQIRELENKIYAEESKTTELNLLREFSFDIKSNYESKETVALGSIIEGKKIIVIGGHINWRNNLKKKYPAIQVYDGHVETADLKPLETADFVFLNVSNMSHGMYYRVIDVLRKGDVPFDYLGRTINQELYEKEMADILQKRKFHS